MKMECYKCKKTMKKGKVTLKNIVLEGWICECGEKIVPSKEVVKYEVLTGRRRSDIRTVTKMGNSLVVSIPKEYLKPLHIHRGSKLVFVKDENELKLVPLTAF